MKNIFLVKILLLTVTVSFVFNLVEAVSDNLQVSIQSESQFQKNEIPKIIGTITNQEDQPLDNALVNIVTSENSFWTTTNKDGKFKLEIGLSSAIGSHPVNIMASKDGYSDGFSSFVYTVFDTSYTSQIITSNNTLSKKQIQNDPLAQKILQQAEVVQKKIAQQEQKRKDIELQQQIIQEQRALAYQELEKDLKQLDADALINAPRNAFTIFVSHVDESVQGIFWAQFELTEKISNEAHVAKLKAIEQGHSSEDAIKIFQKKAAIPRQQVISYNKNLNIQHGFSDPVTQDKFDDDGKLPRKDE